METVGASDYIFKIIAVGEASVGKTSLTLRYATDKFDEDYRMTLGLNLSNKNVKLDDNGEAIVVQLSIWDTGGQISFAPLLPMYYKGALGAFVVYDITKEKTYKLIDKWVQEIRQHCNEIPIVLVGNKNDLEDQREVSTEEGKAKAEEIAKKWSNQIFFFETSAKEDIRVNESFTTLAKTILNLVESQEDVEEPTFTGIDG